MTYFNENQNKTTLALMDDLSKTPLEKEKYAYFVYKNAANVNSKTRGATTLTFAGLGAVMALLPALTPNASDSNKSTVSITGLLFLALGIYSYFTPSIAETEMEKIDAELAK